MTRDITLRLIVIIIIIISVVVPIDTSSLDVSSGAFSKRLRSYDHDLYQSIQTRLATGVDPAPFTL